jgi:hypothetical protein
MFNKLFRVAKMPRGGIHKGTLKPEWNAGKTCTIRVPEARKNEILALAKALDKVDYEVEIIEKQSYEKLVIILEDALDLQRFPRNNSTKHRKVIMEALHLLGKDIEHHK